MSHKISNEELIKNLKEFAVKLGRTPRREDLLLSLGSKYSANAYKRAFGTINNAILKSGLIPNMYKNVSDEELIKAVKDLYNYLGRTPEIREFNLQGNSLTGERIIQRFGSWNKFLKLAGIPITTNRNVSTEEVREALHKYYEENNKEITCLTYWRLRKAKKTNDFPYSTATIITKAGDGKTWEEVIRFYGFEEYETIDQFIKRGYFKGLDDNIYLSEIEKYVGDILFDLKKNNKISSYTYEAVVCPERNWTCDFMIEKLNKSLLWLEIDGMINNRKDPYKSGNDKIEYYKDNNFQYNIITYRDNNIKFKISALLNSPHQKS